MRDNADVAFADRAPVSDPGDWEPPAVRADALLMTWAMMLLGHVLGAALATFALVGGSPDRSGSAVAAFWAVLVLGVAGGGVAWQGLGVTRQVRRAEQRGRVPTVPMVQPIVLAVGVALLAVGVAVIVIAQWGAGGVLPAVGGELVFVALALRTQRYLDDARAAARPWR